MELLVYETFTYNDCRKITTRKGLRSARELARCKAMVNVARELATSSVGIEQQDLQRRKRPIVIFHFQLNPLTLPGSSLLRCWDTTRTAAEIAIPRGIALLCIKIARGFSELYPTSSYDLQFVTQSQR